MSQLVIHTDGGARGNPGPAAIGVVFTCDGKQLLHERYIGTATNNVAEYTAVLDALEQLPAFMVENLVEKIQFCLDSELVVKQITGLYRVKEPFLQSLHQKVKESLAKLTVPCHFQHVPRAQNAQADKLVNHALDNYV